jgi:peptidyl-tRNA hydrolase
MKQTSWVGSPGKPRIWKHVTNINPLKTSGNYMYHLLVRSITLHFTHRVYVWVSYVSQNKQRLFFLKSKNYFGFVMVKSCVFFAVRTEFVNITLDELRLQRGKMDLRGIDCEN